MVTATFVKKIILLTLSLRKYTHLIVRFVEFKYFSFINNIVNTYAMLPFLSNVNLIEWSCLFMYLFFLKLIETKIFFHNGFCNFLVGHWPSALSEWILKICVRHSINTMTVQLWYSPRGNILIGITIRLKGRWYDSSLTSNFRVCTQKL